MQFSKIGVGLRRVRNERETLSRAYCNGVFSRTSSNSRRSPQNVCYSERTCLYGETASTVIIGGGVVGTSIAYHLAKQGAKNVVLLEKSELTAGSTWHAAGLATTFHPGINVKKIHYYSVNLYAQLEAETGQNVGFHQPGSIRITREPHRIDEFRHQMSRMGGHDTPQCLLTPQQIKELAPIVDTDKIICGLYTPYDGHIDPYSLTQALAKGARRYGATILLDSGVTSLGLREDGRWTVATPAGDIVADRVVNAAGFWAREVSALAGNPLPLCAIEHQYLVTKTIPEVGELKRELPVLRDMEASCYIRQERQGLVIGAYESVETMKVRDDWMDYGVTKGFGKELFPSDLDRMTPHAEIVMDAIPCFGSAEIQTVVNGPITYTPDVLPLLGPDTLPNMWIAAGFGYGIIHGGGVGKFLADWILDGEPPYDLIEMEPTRFHWASKDYVKAKVRESYGMNSAIAYPDEERFAGRPTERITTAYDLQLTRGAQMQMHSGWEQPAWFAKEVDQKPYYQPTFERTNWHSSVGEEWGNVTSSVGVVDLSPFGKIVVEGVQAANFVNRVTANRVPVVGRTVLSHALTSEGRVYAEFTVTRLSEDKLLLLTGSASEFHDCSWLHNIARKEGWKVKIASVTDELACLSVAGPHSKKVLAKLNSRFEDKFPFMSYDTISLCGSEMTAIRISYTGELGWEIYHQRDHTGTLYQALLDAGEEFGICDFGTLCLNSMRMEKGFRMWGNEMNVDRDVVAAGLMPFVNMDKGDFIGRKAVEKILRLNPTSVLTMATVDPASPYDPKGDETLWLADKAVGVVTSGCFSYHLQRPLVFAYLPPFLNHKGATLEIELVGQRYACEVIVHPPVLPFNARNKNKTTSQ